jgi:hypothetical protein
MARPVKWSRDLHGIRERAANSKTETWARRDIERLFGVGRASAQSLMKAIGEIQPIGGAHFVERSAILAFMDSMIQSPAVDEALRERLQEAEAPRRPRSLKISVPPDLRYAAVQDLPPNIRISTGRLEIDASSIEGLLESLALLALALQNDFDAVRKAIEPRRAPVDDAALKGLLGRLRTQQPAPEVPSVTPDNTDDQLENEDAATIREWLAAHPLP